VFRIIQELINNCIKHAHATNITIQAFLKDNNHLLCIIISYNGTGIEQDQYREMISKKGAIGLKNVIGRLKVVNGSITFAKTADDKYEIFLSIPYISID